MDLVLKFNCLKFSSVTRQQRCLLKRALKIIKVYRPTLSA
uniref:Uncharacterized protein n=1 Tax=Anguilla anguilla TaxID=7936 RepID=A0A0E9R716_ANGAN